MPFIPNIPETLHLIGKAGETPQFTHDCNCCVFLGQHVSESNRYDLYAHTGGQFPTVIARFGSEPSKYESGACFSYGQMPALTEARVRAQALELWPYNVYEALGYATGNCEQSQAELLRALPFTLEYQAVLAFERGDTERAQGLIRHVFAKKHAHNTKYRTTVTPAQSLLEAQGRIQLIVSTIRRLSFVKSVNDIDGLTTFLWDELNTSPRALIREALEPQLS
jgi:hypothetical protein